MATPFGTTQILAAGDPGKPALVVHHGKAMSSTMWAEHLGLLTESRRVYLVDTVGDMNKSHPTKVVGSPNDVVEWIDVVLDGLAVHQAAFLGHSYGAWMATTYAINRPYRVERLALLAPAAVFERVSISWLARAIWVHVVHPTRAGAERFTATMCEPRTVAELPNSAFGRVVEQYLVGVLGFIGSAGDARPCTYNTAALAPLSMPMLVLVGEDETVCNGPRSAATARARIPHAIVDVVPNANHHILADQPDIVADALRPFLA